MWFVAKAVPAVMVVMFHNLNPGHFFSSCTHWCPHMACDWSLLSNPALWLAEGSHDRCHTHHMTWWPHDTQRFRCLPRPPHHQPSWPGARGDPSLTNMNIIALSQLIVSCPARVRECEKHAPGQFRENIPSSYNSTTYAHSHQNSRTFIWFTCSFQ